MPTKTKTNLATADTAITTEDAAINIAVLSNDSVPASLVKTLYSLAQSGSGVMTTATSKLGATITINPNGTVHYDPTSVATIQALAQGETITDSFIYTMKESTHSGNTVAFGTATVTVTLTGVNDAPVINGTAAGQTTTDATPISPFSHAAITDVDHGAQDSLTIKVTDAGGNPTDANGMLSGSGLLKAGVGTYSFFPTSPGNLTSELDQLVFTPTAHQAAAGTTVTTKFSLAANDGFATTSDATTSVLTTQTAPKIVDYSLTLIDVPNVLTTIPNAINNDDEVAGEYEVNVSSTTTLREGFTSLNGMITPAVYPGALETTVFGINDSGDIAGLWVAPSAPENGDGFIEHGGIFTDIAPIGTANFADAGKINNSQVAIGDMSSNNGGATFGFTYDNVSGTLTPIQHGTDSTFTTDINDSGVVVGFYQDAMTLRNHGFLYQDGQVNTFDVDGATDTRIQAINNLGDIAGEYTDTQNQGHGFLVHNGVRTTFDIPQVFDMNDNDLVVGTTDNGSQALVYANGKVLNISPNTSTIAVAQSVNNNNVVAGSFSDSTRDVRHGFIAHPVTI